MTEVNFVGYECRVLVDDYKKMMLVDKFTGQPVAVATKVVPGVSLENDEVIIKSYSENEGLLEALVTAGIVEPTGKRVASGFVELDICKLLI